MSSTRLWVTVFPLVVGLGASVLGIGLAKPEGTAKGAGVGLPLAPCASGNYAVSVTPDGGSASWPAYSNGHTYTFTVTNTSPDCTQTHRFTHHETGPISGVSLNKTVATLQHGQSTTVIATYNTGQAGSGVLSLKSTVDYSSVSDTGYVNVTVQPPPPGVSPPSNWDVTPFNHEHQVMARCAADCFAATYAHASTPYFSLGAPRSLTLAYHGDRIYPKPFILLNVQKPDADTPQYVWLKVTRAGAIQRFANGEDSLKFVADAAGRYQRISGQLRDSTWATGMYEVTVIVTWVYSGSTKVENWLTKLMVVNETGSPLGHGWTLPGVQRLFPQDSGHALVTEGDGSAIFFRKFNSIFISPNGEFSRLETYGSGWRRRYLDSTSVVFSSMGLMTDAYDRFSNHTQFFYDGSNRLYTVRDPNGQDLVLSYGSYLTSIRDNISPFRYTNITVDGNGNLTAIQDPDGRLTGFQYGTGRLWKITARDTGTTTLTYAGNSGKLASVIAPWVAIYGQGQVQPTTLYGAWQLVGLPSPTQVTRTNPVGVALRDTVYGRITEPGGAVTRFTVDHWGQPRFTFNALNDSTVVTYHGTYGLPTRVLYPTGGVDSAVYNSSGLPTYIRAAGTNATSVYYNATWVTQPDSLLQGAARRQAYWFGANGRVDSSEAGPVGSATRIRYRYDARGRDTLVTDPLGHEVVRRHYQGTNGNMNEEIRPGNRVTTHHYDQYGRDTSTTAPGRATQRILYDVLNRVTHVFDGVNDSATRYVYDLDSYDPAEYYAVKVTDPKGQSYFRQVNRLGWVTRVWDPNNQPDIYQYDRDGHLRQWTTRRALNVYYQYDALHRLVKRYGDNLQADSLAYSTDYRVIKAISPLDTETTFLNVRGQPDSVKTHLYSWDYWRRYAYTYDGLLDSIWGQGSDPAFLTRKYRYNAGTGTLDSIRLGGAWTRLTLNGDLQPTYTSFPGGDQTIRAFTSSHGDMRISASVAYDTATDRRITYDAAGRLWRQLRYEQPAGYGGGHLYAYDLVGRLVADTVVRTDNDQYCTGSDPHFGIVCTDFWSSWWALSGPTIYSYDQVGNRTDNSGSYTTGNRITAFNGCSYATDAAGNVTQRACPGQTLDITWDALNRPVTFTLNGAPWAFKYDATGRLLRQDSSGVVKSYFLWDGDNLFAELNGSDGNKRAEYSYYPGLDQLHALVIGDTTYYAHTDGMGNVVALTGADQGLKKTYTYLPWGTLWNYEDYAGLAGRDRARFKGALAMGWGLTYMRNRWYEEATGRFLSEDPIGLDGGINPYAFAANDPVNGSDPTGLKLMAIGDVYWDCYEFGDAMRCYPVLLAPVTIEGHPSGNNNGSGGSSWPYSWGAWGGGSNDLAGAGGGIYVALGTNLLNAGIQIIKLSRMLTTMYNFVARPWIAAPPLVPPGQVPGVTAGRIGSSLKDLIAVGKGVIKINGLGPFLLPLPVVCSQPWARDLPECGGNGGIW